MNSGAPKRSAVPVLHVTPVVLQLNGTNIIRYENRVGNHDTNWSRDEYIFFSNILFVSKKSDDDQLISGQIKEWRKIYITANKPESLDH